MNSTQKAFIDKMLPHAQRASKQLDIPVSVLLAQWGIESAWGTSGAVKKYNNYSGIMYTANADYKGGVSAQGTAFAGFNSIDSWVNDYIRILSMNKYGYKEVRDAVSVADTVKALALSSYDAGHYEGGAKVMNTITSNNLTQYDGMTPVGTFTPANFTLEKPNIDNMSNDDLKKYALIGFLAVGMVALLNK